MNPITRITSVVTTRLGVANLIIQKHSPELYLAGGIAAGITAAVLLARAYKVTDRELSSVRQDIDEVRNAPTVDDVKDEMDEEAIEENLADGTLVVDEQIRRKELSYLYSKAAVTLVRLYAPPVLAGTTSIVLILASHNVMKTRNKALLGLATLFERGLAQYRARVVAELGEEADERFYYGADARKVTNIVTDENGENQKVKGTRNYIPEVVNPVIYQRVFDDTNHNWSNNYEMNDFFLRAAQTAMNNRLYLQGYVMLNTVYKSLGMSETPEGAVVGWSNSAPGDNFIDFGLDREINKNPGDGRYILDFNVNGVVFEYIGVR